MPPILSDLVARLPIVDVHEHHLPAVFLQPEVNLLQLFQQSYAGWAIARPYCLPSETRDADPMLAAAGPTTWEALAPYLDRHGSNHFVRNLVQAVVALHGDGPAEITPDNWPALDAAVRAAHRRPGWRRRLLKRARQPHAAPRPFAAAASARMP